MTSNFKLLLIGVGDVLVEDVLVEDVHVEDYGRTRLVGILRKKTSADFFNRKT